MKNSEPSKEEIIVACGSHSCAVIFAIVGFSSDDKNCPPNPKESLSTFRNSNVLSCQYRNLLCYLLISEKGMNTLKVRTTTKP